MIDSRPRDLTSIFQIACPTPGTRAVPLVRRGLAGFPSFQLSAFGFTLPASPAAFPFPMKNVVISALVAGLALACQQQSAREMSAAEKKAVADSLKRLVVNAYDLSQPDPVKRLMSLYPDSGRVISASGGVITTTRPQLEQGVRAFWTNVGQNMKNLQWNWTSMNVDVLAPDAAVMTSTYRVPHLTPTGMSHEIGGAWTAVFEKRGGRWVVIQEHLSDVQSNPNLPMNQSMPAMSRPQSHP